MGTKTTGKKSAKKAAKNAKSRPKKPKSWANKRSDFIIGYTGKRGVTTGGIKGLALKIFNNLKDVFPGLPLKEFMLSLKAVRKPMDEGDRNLVNFYTDIYNKLKATTRKGQEIVDAAYQAFLSTRKDDPSFLCLVGHKHFDDVHNPI